MQSTTAAEYMAACMAMKEVVWLRIMMDELGIGKRRPTVVYQDNQACIKIANGEGHYDASQHFII